MSDQPILSVENLRKTFGGIVAVDGVSFRIEEGSITGLIGPNGAGKTTTFNVVSGFFEPDRGTVRYRGQDIQDLMGPTPTEQAIWSSSGAVTFGLAGLSAAAHNWLWGVLPSRTVGAAAGAVLGVGIYYGQEGVRRQLLRSKRNRPFQLSRHGLVRTFQITRELQEMTVRENMMLAPKGQSGESLLRSWFRRGQVRGEERAVRERAEEVIETLELEHLADEYAGNLSGGQRKLVELGRVLMTDPDLILLDEPVAGVNPTLTRKLLNRIRDLRDEGYTFLIVEHDMEVIMNLSETIIVMTEGRKLMEGTPEEVQQDDRVLEAYLGG